MPTQSDLFLAVDMLTEPEPVSPDYTDYSFMSVYQLIQFAWDVTKYDNLTEDSKSDLALALADRLREVTQ